MATMEAMMTAMRQSMTDLTTEMVNVRTILAQTQALVNQNQAGLNTLTTTSTAAWQEKDKKINEMKGTLDDLQAHLAARAAGMTLSRSTGILSTKVPSRSTTAPRRTTGLGRNR